MPTLLRDVIKIPEWVPDGEFVLKLTDGVEHTAQTVDDYVVTPDIERAFDRALNLVESAVRSGRSQAAFLHGSFGSGKSHFMAVLHALLRHHEKARGKVELAEVIAKHDAALRERKFLPLTFHLIGAPSLAAALLGGYVAQIRRLHPHDNPPVVHQTDLLFADAQAMRDTVGDEVFFAKLNADAAGSGPNGGAWQAFTQTWDAASCTAAREAAPEDQRRQDLAGALTRTFFTGYTHAGEYIDIDSGLRVISEHAKGLGYDAVVLFLDELVLWLISKASNQEFFNTEASNVTKLVESADAHRPIPLVSFIARQRDLRDFLNRHALGADEAAFGTTVLWQDDRFDKIVLGDENLPLIAEQRLLQPLDETTGPAVLDAAFARVDRRPDVWNTLLDGVNSSEEHRGSDQTSFRRLYPFNPALVDALRALAGQMKRDRTALRVMQQILVQQRDELTVDDLVPIGDVFDLVVSGDQALTPQTERLFGSARRLYRDEFLPLLLRQHGLTADQAERVGYRHPFRNDARLVKTLLLAAMVEQVPALHQLDARRLAGLNHGTIASPLPGDEPGVVLTKVRQWKTEIPALRLSGDDRSPTISVQLSEVDWRGVLDNVASHDDLDARRLVLREMVWKALNVRYDPTLLGVQPHTLVWRGSRRMVELVFGNVRDPSDLSDAQLVHAGNHWRIVVDYPFDAATETRSNDFARLEGLRARDETSRTICWIPYFLTEDRVRELSTLTQIEYLFATPDGFESNADHLSVTDRTQARAIIENLQVSLRQRLDEVLRQAYGATAPSLSDVDTTGEDRVLETLDAFRPQNPVGGTLAAAFENIVDRALTDTYPAHPDLGPGEVRVTDARRALGYVERARQAEQGRVDNVNDVADRAALKRLVGPLELGRFRDNVYVLDAATFPWRNRFAGQLGQGDTVTVGEVRAWLDLDARRGFDELVGNLVISAWAVVTDRSWYRYGGRLPTPPALDAIRDDMQLREQPLPSPEVWADAVAKMQGLFGRQERRRLSASGVSGMVTDVRQRVHTVAADVDRLVDLLTGHATGLGIDLAAPTGRLATARSAVRIVGDLRAARDDLAVIAVLASANLSAEPVWVGTSIEQARTVADVLTGTRWELFSSLERIVDARRAAAQAILDRVKTAGAADEFRVKLAPVLRAAENEASTLLADLPEPPVVTPDPVDNDDDAGNAGGGLVVDTITVPAAAVDDAVERVREFAAANPDRRIVITLRAVDDR
jgi:hypothetical protein